MDPVSQLEQLLADALPSLPPALLAAALEAVALWPQCVRLSGPAALQELDFLLFKGAPVRYERHAPAAAPAADG